MYQRFGLFIGGEWRPASGGATIDVVDPSTEEILGSTPRASAQDLDGVLVTLADAARSWRAQSGWDRSAILVR